VRILLGGDSPAREMPVKSSNEEGEKSKVAICIFLHAKTCIAMRMRALACSSRLTRRHSLAISTRHPFQYLNSAHSQFPSSNLVCPPSIAVCTHFVDDSAKRRSLKCCRHDARSSYRSAIFKYASDVSTLDTG
jgi:hypothetical protein